MFRKSVRHHYSLFVLIFLIYSVSYDACAVVPDEFIRDGGFELGVVDVDIVRYPRLSNVSSNDLRPPVRDQNKPISGKYSLQLPGLYKGGYRLVYRVVQLVNGQNYRLSLDTRVDDKTSSIQLEVFNVWDRIKGTSVNLKPGTKNISMDFVASTKTGIKGDESPFFIRVWVKSNSTVWLDNVSLRGPRGHSGAIDKLRIWLEPDKAMSVYPIDANGVFTIQAIPCRTCKLSYRINDPMNDVEIASGSLLQGKSDNYLTAKIPLNLTRRGFYWVTAIMQDQQGIEIATTKRSYVVINPEPTPGVGHERFGMCMEEYGPDTQIDAFTTPEDYYLLANQIGVGSVRIFSLLMPDLISNDGIHYDFSEVDSTITLMKSLGIEPMAILGSNDIQRIPRWMRESDKTSNSIDLSEGLRVPAERKKFERTQSDIRYLSLDKYQHYLSAIFSHFKGKIKYYELWNEPGHKFLTEDILQIAKLTREIQQDVDPDSYLLGYSSTRRGNIGAGKDPLAMPKFIHEVQLAGGLNYIDILSYHSGHAFLFMNDVISKRNLETKYVPRLRELLKRSNKSDMPIWDSERGIPWKSPHKERQDYKYGVKRWKYEGSSSNVLDVARQLPMVYSSAFANKIERIFWFCLESSAGLIQRSDMRWEFFDAQREPMPQIPVYDAMTELLQNAVFDRLIESDNGSRAYVFHNKHNAVVLAYNWEGKTDLIIPMQENVNNIQVLDIMGNPVLRKPENNTAGIIIDEWPRYIMLPLASGDIIKYQ